MSPPNTASLPAVTACWWAVLGVRHELGPTLYLWPYPIVADTSYTNGAPRTAIQICPGASAATLGNGRKLIEHSSA
jgi:hypothetical protein